MKKKKSIFKIIKTKIHDLIWFISFMAIPSLILYIAFDAYMKNEEHIIYFLPALLVYLYILANHTRFIIKIMMMINYGKEK